MWEFIDKAVYINLDHREDRRQLMNKFKNEGHIPDEKFVRYSAVSNSNGIIGCALSHIGVLKMAKKHEWKSVLILEDDLEWIDFNVGYAHLEETIAQEPWDVCLLTGIYRCFNYPKLTAGVHTNAYIVKHHYYDTLIDNMEAGLRKKLTIVKPPVWNVFKMKSYLEMYDKVYAHAFNIDVYWIKLQQRDKWIAANPICHQVQSYSDINKLFVSVPYGFIPNDPEFQNIINYLML
jgi:hypothetical protein